MCVCSTVGEVEDDNVVGSVMDFQYFVVIFLQDCGFWLEFLSFVKYNISYKNTWKFFCSLDKVVSSNPINKIFLKINSD